MLKSSLETVLKPIELGFITNIKIEKGFSWLLRQFLIISYHFIFLLG